MVEAGVGAEGDVVALGVGEAQASDGGCSDFAGVFVGTGFYGFGEGATLAGLDGEASAFDGGFGQGNDAAAAVEAVWGGVDELPDGVVVAKDLAVECSMAG